MNIEENVFAPMIGMLIGFFLLMCVWELAVYLGELNRRRRIKHEVRNR